VKVGAIKEFSSSLNHLANLDMFRNLPKFYGEFDKQLNKDMNDLDNDVARFEETFAKESGSENFASGYTLLIAFIAGMVLFGGVAYIITLYRKRHRFVRTSQNDMF
jgi:hypothetical protein